MCWSDERCCHRDAGACPRDTCRCVDDNLSLPACRRRASRGRVELSRVHLHLSAEPLWRSRMTPSVVRGTSALVARTPGVVVVTLALVRGTTAALLETNSKCGRATPRTRGTIGR